MTVCKSIGSTIYGMSTHGTWSIIISGVSNLHPI